MSGSIIERLWRSLPQAIRGSPPADQLVLRIRDHAGSLRGASDQELQSTSDTLRQAQARDHGRQESLIVPAFAAVCESVRRCYGLELFDVQLHAGLAVARGDIAEMQTGEGKTLAIAAPAFLRAITDRGVHVVTPNSYLARRDFELLLPVYRRLGCTAGLLPENPSGTLKRQAYAAEITYGTGYEFGFDYLRQRLAQLRRRQAPLGSRYRKLLEGNREAPLLEARRSFAIIDEIDSVLIDEASTPLILSERPHDAEVATSTYEYALRVALALVPNRDYIVDPSGSRSTTLTARGRRQCHQGLRGVPAIFSAGPWTDLIQQALQSLHGLRRDVDYVVQRDKVILVDPTTGRLCPERAWRNGLQQLLEVKEGLPVTPARTTAARISRQRYFSLYAQLSGMTGTALESAHEFRKTYGLSVTEIPPRLACRRRMLPDRTFVDAASRWIAVEKEIVQVHATGRPMLIGCRTIENSEQLARRLDAAGVAYQLLNGKQTAAEAAVISRAGDAGAVTIATNMAGRGTDIKLARDVAQLGGMHLIAVERNESLRIDRQLLGRVGRQGDPGSCQFFLSADDQLLTQFAPQLRERIHSLPQIDGEVSEDLSEPVREAQRRCEASRYAARQEVAAADAWLCDELGSLLQ